MTDISSLRPHADPQLTPVAPFSPAPSSLIPNGHASADPSLDDEESSTIKCICGYQDDDGHTVLCEKCNTWQHIACYYESLVVPEIHECADCCPRPVDVKGATERQRQRIRELASVGDRRVKKPASKSHKKKVKESSVSSTATAAALTPGGGTGSGAGAGSLPNGWPADKSDSHYADRKSGSPKDHQPPAKRPKTSHKSSASVSAIGHHGAGPVLAATSGNRKRAPSAATNGHSPTKSPTSPATNGYSADYFSPEFLQLYRHSEYQEMRENSYSDISLTNDLTEWLEDPEALAEVTDGLKPQDVFARAPSMEALEKSAPVIIKQVDSDRSIVSNGLYPVWHWLTVETHVPEGSYVGELTGLVCRQRDYCSAPSSRWQTLRHPEPFVFFPPYLPLAIDARKGSTVMRFARRSCDPNMEMRIFIGADKIYHFCFVATRDIEVDQELTLPWAVDPDIRRLLGTVLNNGNIGKDGIRGVEELSQWVAGVLSNFGGCACKRARGDCLLERADRRNGSYLPDLAVHPSKIAKARKLKKQQQQHHHHHNQQISPLSTGHATNSRAGSEALKAGDHDDDMADTRSVSGSTRSKPGSRDITPMTHVSTDAMMGFGGVELSDREKRKLMQSERLFEQLEYDEQHGHKRKKRNSAGSTLNTPSASTSKQLGYPDAVMSSISAKTRAVINGQRVNGTHSRSGNRSMKPPQKPRPDYVDTSTQTEGDSTVGSASNPNFIRRTRVPYYRELLNRARDERLRREAQDQEKREGDSQPQTPTSNKLVGSNAPRTPEPTVMSAVGTVSDQTVSGPVKTEQQDTDMVDVGASTDSPPADFRKPDAPSLKSPTASAATAATSTTENAAQTSHPPAHPPAPPWPSTSPTTASTATEAPVSIPPLKPSNLRVDLPPAPDFSQISSAATQTTTTPNSTTSGPLTGQTIAQSPSTVTAQSPSAFSASHGPIFSPSVASAVTPSPMAKRLSLSDYMARQKARKQEAQAQAQATHGSIPESAEGQSHEHASDTNANSTTANDAPSKDVDMKDAGSSDTMEVDSAAAAVAVKEE